MRIRPGGIRSFLVAATFLLLGGLGTWYAIAPTRWTSAAAPADPDSALAELRHGNARFIRSARTQSTDTCHDAELRRQTAKHQHPFAAVLCCSDSRVVPDFIFDQRAGSMFEVRNAGNVVDEDVLASFEYAVEHFHVPIMVVLAHKGCGAVHAVCESGGKPLHDHLRELQKNMCGIQSDIDKATGRLDASAVDELCQKNAKHQALKLLRDSRVLQAAVDRGETRLLYGIYDMDSGVVEFLELDSR